MGRLLRQRTAVGAKADRLRADQSPHESYDRAIRRASPSFAAILAALAVGCGNDDQHVPAACLDGNLPRALAQAPGAVRVEGTRLSDCFTRGAAPAEIQELGSVFVSATERLAARARAKPHSRAAVELGYLIGAVHRGTGGTQGIHYETRRRIEQELLGVHTDAPEYVQGEKAGERTG